MALVGGCTSAAPRVPVERGDCAPVTPVVHLSAHSLTVHEGVLSHTRSPVPSDLAAFVGMLRELADEGDLRRACTDRDTVVLPEADTPVTTVLATIRATSGCFETTRVSLQRSEPPVPVHGLHFCHVPLEELPERPRCSQARIAVDPHGLRLRRVAQGFPLARGPLFGGPVEADDPTPASLALDFEGPHRIAALLAALERPHAGLPNCDTASFVLDPELRWGEVVPLLTAFERSSGLAMFLD